MLYDEKAIGHHVSGTGTKEVTASVPERDDIIRWVDFKTTTSLNEPGAVTFSGTAKQTIFGSVPIYFLPWRSMQLVGMSIPQLKESDYDNDKGNPNIFFTAAINGCSVFIKGSPTAPEVFHGGIDGTLAIDAVQFWRDCLDKVAMPGRPPHEVNKTHYTKDSSFTGKARTPLAADYFKWLEDAHRNKFTISEVSPWGCVFGIRYGRLWSFYLQENATVTTLEFVKKKLVDTSGNWPKLKSGAQANITAIKQQKSFMGIKHTETIYANKRTTTRPMLP